jgi:hypothetical protein
VTKSSPLTPAQKLDKVWKDHIYLTFPAAFLSMLPYMHHPAIIRAHPPSTSHFLPSIRLPEAPATSSNAKRVRDFLQARWHISTANDHIKEEVYDKIKRNLCMKKLH